MTCIRSAFHRVRIGAGLAAIALFALAAPAGALSLADLKADDFSITSGGVEFSDFKVRLRGLGLDHDLESHIVTFEEGRLQVDLAHGFQNRRGRLMLKYIATAVGGELTGAGLDVTGDDVTVRNRIRGVGKLQFISAKPDRAVLGLELGELEKIKVRAGIRVKTGNSPADSSVGTSYAMAAPEPGTAALFALGLAGIAAARRRPRA